MKNMNKIKNKRLEIRLSDLNATLYNSIKKAAKKENRSMGKEVINTIQKIY